MKIATLLIPAIFLAATFTACEEETRPRQRENTAARSGGGNQFGYQPTEGTATDFVTDATPTPTPTPTPGTSATPPDTDQSFVEATPTPTPDPAVSTETRDIPYATPVAGRPGFVTSPFAPYEGYVDVRGYPPNTEVKDPYSGKIFLVP